MKRLICRCSQRYHNSYPSHHDNTLIMGQLHLYESKCQIVSSVISLFTYTFISILKSDNITSSSESPRLIVIQPDIFLCMVQSPRDTNNLISSCLERIQLRLQIMNVEWFLKYKSCTVLQIYIYIVRRKKYIYSFLYLKTNFKTCT